MKNNRLCQLILGLVLAISVNATVLAYPMDEQTKAGTEAYQAGDYQKALKLLTKASDAGNPDASEMLAQMYYNGKGVSKDYSKAYKLLQPAIKAGYPDAYYFLGQMYYFGFGVAENKQKAIKLYTKAANAGYNVAQNKLASLYIVGHKYSSVIPIDQNVPEAYNWDQLSMINGFKPDKSTKTDYSTFMNQYPYCIALGQDNVGQAYYQGIGGLEQSDSKALDWLQKAAETDSNVGVVNVDLAKMYHINGDDQKAFEAAQQAVNSPYAPAMQYLGSMYQQGIGTDKDSVKAYAYLSLAVDLYQNPDDQFYSKYVAPCMPNYKQTTKEFNKETAQQQLDQIDLSDKQKEQADKLIKEVKSKFK